MSNCDMKRLNIRIEYRLKKLTFGVVAGDGGVKVFHRQVVSVRVATGQRGGTHRVRAALRNVEAGQRVALVSLAALPGNPRTRTRQVTRRSCKV